MVYAIAGRSIRFEPSHYDDPIATGAERNGLGKSNLLAKRHFSLLLDLRGFRVE
jgi:hypothetical protein